MSTIIECVIAFLLGLILGYIFGSNDEPPGDIPNWHYDEETGRTLFDFPPKK